MCVVSMIGDHYNDKWNQPDYQDIFKRLGQQTSTVKYEFGVPRSEFDALKKEVEEMKELLKRAIEYDKKNDEPDCQLEGKIATLRKIAELVGVNLDDVLKQIK